ncbi:MAG: flagellar assembly protein FliW [Alkalispirochaetaceae bacterium]
MTIETKPFGRIEVDQRQLLTFPRGLYGFDHLRQFALLDSERPPFYWLQSLEESGIAFVLINPYIVRSDYILEVPDEDVQLIGTPPGEEILVFAIVTIPSDGSEITCNLQGPLIINRSERIGHQSISLHEAYHTKHGILEEMRSSRSDPC